MGLELDYDGLITLGSITEWHAGPVASRTHTKHTYSVITRRPDVSKFKPESRKYRNPVFYARELYEEMVNENLTRKQLGERHGVSSDRITQWLCLLKLPEEKLSEIETLGDYWERRVLTERSLRRKQQC